MLLFLSRVHPKKGIETLLRAWARVEGQNPDWDLKIVGVGAPEYLDDLSTLVAKLGLSRASLPGPLYGTDKQKVYDEADLFILPTHSENFGLVVAEALASGCPAIVTRGAPWAGLEQHGCGWWIAHSVEEMATTLQDALKRPAAELSEMGTRGRLWMQKEFSWRGISEQMAEAYEWTLHGGRVPTCVRVG